MKQRVGRVLIFSNSCLGLTFSTIARTGVGITAGIFAEIDLNDQCRVHDVSVWLAQDMHNPDPSHDTGQ